MPVPSKAQLAAAAATRETAVAELRGRLGEMTPGPGQFAVTIRVDRPDGQFVTSTCLVPDDLMSGAAPDIITRQQMETGKVVAGFASAYQRAAELGD